MCGSGTLQYYVLQYWSWTLKNDLNNHRVCAALVAASAKLLQ